MNISKENYEIWFMDFADGKLSAEEKVSLQAFLDLHPELHSEFETFRELHSITFNTEFVQVADKSTLKKNIQPTPAIHVDNYTEFIIADMEGDLSENEKAELSSFIAKNPVIKKEQHLLRATKLHPDKAILFPKKNSLKKTLIVGMRPVIIMRIAAAAVFIGIIFSLFQNSQNANITDFNPIVKTTLPAQNNPENKIQESEIEKQMPEKEQFAIVTKTSDPVIKKAEKLDGVSLITAEPIQIKSENIALVLQNQKESLSLLVTEAEKAELVRIAEEKTAVVAVAELFSSVTGSETIEKNVKVKKRLKAFDFVKTGFEMAARRENSNAKITEHQETGGRKKVHLFTPFFEAEFAMKVD